MLSLLDGDITIIWKIQYVDKRQTAIIFGATIEQRCSIHYYIHKLFNITMTRRTLKENTGIIVYLTIIYIIEVKA